MLRTEDEIRARLIETMDPESIILFGSRAAGTAAVTSDFDLLIVTTAGTRPSDRRAIAERALSDRAVPIDIFVYTPAEMRYLHSIGSPFIDEVLETGRVLYVRKATEQWILDAEDELSSARILLANGKTRTACFHSQQCVEKCLKALIIEKGERPEKTHDILELGSHARRAGWGIDLEVEDAVFLNSIYKGRYPSEEGLLPYGEPTEQDARRAVSAAENAFRSMKKAIG